MYSVEVSGSYHLWSVSPKRHGVVTSKFRELQVITINISSTGTTKPIKVGTIYKGHAEGFAGEFVPSDKLT